MSDSDDRDSFRDDASRILDSLQRTIAEMKAVEESRVELEPRRVESTRAQGRRVDVEIRPEKKGVFSFFKNIKRVPIPGRPWSVVALLYVLTWISTTFVGKLWYGEGSWLRGLLFSAPLMTILTCHELGHFLQNRRYRVNTTPPYFIPFPLPPLGTFGALIFIRSRIPNNRALFDVGVSGPLAGLVVTLIFLVVGLSLSTVVPTTPELMAQGGFVFSEPLIVKWTARLVCGYDSATQTLLMHPIAVAAWVGVLLTTLNLFPIGQLDGGHVFYSLTGKYARRVSYVLYGLAVACVLVFHCWNWILLLILLFFFGLRHPQPTDDVAPLDLKRKIIGWATLAFIFVGFSVNPLDYKEPVEPPTANSALDSTTSDRSAASDPTGPASSQREDVL